MIQGFAYEGTAADVWSLGVTLYAMLAGYLPFEAESLPAVFDKAQVKRNNALFSTRTRIRTGLVALSHRSYPTLLSGLFLTEFASFRATACMKSTIGKG